MPPSLGDRALARSSPRRLPMQPNPDSSGSRATIISQQLTKAAISIGKRLEEALAPEGMNPDESWPLRTRPFAVAAFRAAGEIARSVQGDGRNVNLGQLSQLGDDEVRECLVQIHGIGPWSADMFLMFSLGRMDVLPVGDLGLRAGVKKLYQMRQLPTPERLEKLARPWQPYRSIATWYIWRSLGPVPQS